MPFNSTNFRTFRHKSDASYLYLAIDVGSISFLTTDTMRRRSKAKLRTTQLRLDGYLRPAICFGRRGPYWKAARHREENLLELDTCPTSAGERDDEETETDEQFINTKAIPLTRFCRDAEVESPRCMLDWAENHEDRVAEVTHLRLNVLWVTGTKTGQKLYWSHDRWVTEEEAINFKERGSRVRISDEILEATSQKIEHELDDWTELFAQLSVFATNLRALEVYWYGHEFKQSWVFVQALGKLKLASHAVLYGSYAASFPHYLEQNLGVPVRIGPGSMLIPNNHPLGIPDFKDIKSLHIRHNAYLDRLSEHELNALVRLNPRKITEEWLEDAGSIDMSRHGDEELRCIETVSICSDSEI